MGAYLRIVRLAVLLIKRTIFDHLVAGMTAERKIVLLTTNNFDSEAERSSRKGVLGRKSSFGKLLFCILSVQA